MQGETRHGLKVADNTRASGKLVLGFVVILALIIFMLEMSWHRPGKQMAVQTCFHDAHHLAEGAAVMIAGVKVGVVRRITVRPLTAECPAEAEILFTTPYPLTIPRDSAVSLGRAGLLGETEIIIDSRKASGPAVENGGWLRSEQ